MKRKPSNLKRPYTKRFNIDEIMNSLGISGEMEKYGTARLPITQRNVRYLSERGVFQIGDEDFDRWANSVEQEFYVWQQQGIRQLLRWLNDQGITVDK